MQKLLQRLTSSQERSVPPHLMPRVFQQCVLHLQQSDLAKMNWLSVRRSAVWSMYWEIATCRRVCAPT
ncbi:hypothetical protein niasHT_032698 [Heterodera trifolii]|uniref:Uncharacterized protein n=1 Tax=Heterodera trifolii TaxID=157864 RepID=A0ABD2IDM0_9BILA